MYNFIFIFIYKLIEKRDSDPIFKASTTVFLAQSLHFFMLIAIIKYYGDFVIPRLHESYYINKWMNAPFFLVWVFIVGWYYSKNFSKIIAKYQGKKKSDIYSLKNILLVILAYLVPLLVGIKFINLAAVN